MILPGQTDNSAVAVTGALLLVQVAVLCWALSETLRHLHARRIEVRTFARHVAQAGRAEDVRISSVAALARAWRATFRSGEDLAGERELVEPREAFEADRLIPHEYNGRLDAAAPGVFTALGIVGTFLGLILAFRQIDPQQSEQSIGPLISGMSIVFWNSLGGVLLSIVWTVGSRWARHAFERACHELTDAVEQRVAYVTPGGQVLTALATLDRSVATLGAKLDAVVGEGRQARSETSVAANALQSTLELKLDALAAATRSSSTDLLNTLAPQLERAFKSLVDTPFENLSRTVEQYRTTVEVVAERHGLVLDGLDAAVSALGAAQTGLAAATADTARCVLQFEAFVERVGAESERSAALLAERGTSAAEMLREQTERAGTIVERGRETAEALGTGAAALKGAAERQAEVSNSLVDAVGELRAVTGGLGQISTTFGVAAERLEAAVGQVQRLGVDAAQDSARVAREELQAAVVQMASALREFGEQNVAAYEASSGRVIEVVDGRMTDLTDRLSAELNTLLVRLPDVAEAMTGAAKTVRAQLDRAVRGLDDAVRQLDAASRQSLKARLEEYDGAVAKAVDHFSGTLLVWDGKVGELSSAVRGVETALTPRLGGRQEHRNGDGPVPAGDGPLPAEETAAAPELAVS